MKKSVSAIAIFLLLCLLMPVFAMGVFALPVKEANAAYTDTPVTSSAAADWQNGTLEIDNTGRLWYSDGDTYALLASLDAAAIAVVDDTLWYAAENEIRTYDLHTGMIAQVLRADDKIRCFAFFEKSIYYLTENEVFVRNGRKTRKIDVDAPDKIGVEPDGALILYYENPKYLDESIYDVGLLESENDEYITYRWDSENGEATLCKLTEPSLAELREMVFNADESSYVINGVTFPLSNYPVGSFFTKNGSSCTCHNRGICVEALSSKGCNCMRYWPNERNYQIDLAASQCMGFARYCQWMIYHSIDYQDSLYQNVFGKQLSAGSWTASKLRGYMMDAGAGGHLRTGSGHSLFVISVNSTGFVTYECNKSTAGGYCQIYTRTWTWESFFEKYGSRALLYYNMPEMEVHTSDVMDGYRTGYYLITAESGLRLRSNHSTSGTSTLDVLPLGTLVQVTEIYRVSDDEYWGKVKYEGQTGWISMEYAAYQNATVKSITITEQPSKTTYIEGDSFSTAGLEVSALFTSGISTPISGYTCSGYNMSKVGKQTVKVTYQGCTASFTIEVLQKKIEPTAVKFSENLLVLLHGDSMDLNEAVTITPANATERALTWTCSNQDSDYIRFENGKLTAMKDCSATITVRTSNGKTASCEVLITHLPQDTEKEFSDVLPKLPDGITPQDYLVQYKKGTGSWVSYSSGDEVVYKSDYSYRFRNYIADVIVSGASAPGYPASTSIGTKFDLSKGIFKQDHSENELFAGFTVSEDNKTPQACGSVYFSKGDAVFYARTISLSQMTLAADPRDALHIGQTELSPFAFAGVGVRVDDDPDYFGLRFYTRLSKRLLSEISSLYSKNKSIAPASGSDKGIGYGSVVVLKSALGSSELVKGKTSSSYLKDKAVVTVPAVSAFAEYDNYIIYTALVCGYTDAYYKTDFAARPYLTFYTCNGVQTTYYDKVTGSNSKSGAYYTNLYAEAKAIFNTLSADTPEDVSARKWYEDKFGF